jgi:hypothetical protein
MRAITEDNWHPVRNSNLTPQEYKYKPCRSVRMFPYCVPLNNTQEKIYRNLRAAVSSLSSRVSQIRSLEFALYPREVDKCETDGGLQNYKDVWVCTPSMSTSSSSWYVTLIDAFVVWNLHICRGHRFNKKSLICRWEQKGTRRSGSVHILHSAIASGEWIASCSGHLTPFIN